MAVNPKTKVVILAGGAGTRLGLKDIPKPMAEIGGRPLLEHQIALAARHGLTDILLLTGHLSEVIESHFGDGTRFGVRIAYYREPAPLGTAGAFADIRRRLAGERFLVFYGDVVMDFDIDAFLEFDRRDPDSLGTVIVHPNNHPHDSDLLEADAGRVVRIHRKPRPEGAFTRNLSNAAVYVLSERILDFVERGASQDWARDIFPKVLAAGGTLRAYNTTEYIRDMGTPDRFAAARRDWESGKVAGLNRAHPRAAVFLDRDGVLVYDVGNLADIDKLELIPGAAGAVRAINRSGLLAVVVTNQPVLAKGWLDVPGLDRIHAKLETLLGREGAYLDRIYYCPHHPDRGFEGEVAELKIDCDCRKPKPGLLLRARDDMNIDLSRSFMIGDRDTDVEAGRAAGVRESLRIERDRADALAGAVAGVLERFGVVGEDA